MKHADWTLDWEFLVTSWSLITRWDSSKEMSPVKWKFHRASGLKMHISLEIVVPPLKMVLDSGLMLKGGITILLDADGVDKCLENHFSHVICINKEAPSRQSKLSPAIRSSVSASCSVQFLPGILIFVRMIIRSYTLVKGDRRTCAFGWRAWKWKRGERKGKKERTKEGKGVEID
jgi:hypothetical protein